MEGGEGSQFRVGRPRSGYRKSALHRTPNAVRAFHSRHRLDHPPSRSDFRSARRCLRREDTDASSATSLELAGDASDAAKSSTDLSRFGQRSLPWQVLCPRISLLQLSSGSLVAEFFGVRIRRLDPGASLHRAAFRVGFEFWHPPVSEHKLRQIVGDRSGTAASSRW